MALTEFTGVVQAGFPDGLRVIQNNAGADSTWRMKGQVWDLDPSNNQLFAEGPNIYAYLDQFGVVGPPEEASDQSPRQYVWEWGSRTDYRSMVVYDLGNQTKLAVPQLPEASTDPAPDFGITRRASPDRPSLILLETSAVTDGTDPGEIVASVDENGDGSTDYFPDLAYADANLPSGTESRDTSTIYLSAGGTYRLNNVSDPTGNNQIGDVREIVL